MESREAAAVQPELSHNPPMYSPLPFFDDSLTIQAAQKRSLSSKDKERSFGFRPHKSDPRERLELTRRLKTGTWFVNVSKYVCAGRSRSQEGGRDGWGAPEIILIFPDST